MEKQSKSVERELTRSPLQRALFRLQKTVRGPLGIAGVLLAAITASIGFSAWSNYRQSEQAVERFVSVWEEEIARNLLLKGDTSLFDKIKTQIPDIARDISHVGMEADAQNASGTCALGQSIRVTLYGTPAGKLQICRSVNQLLLQSLASPVFAFTLLAAVAFLFWSARRRAVEQASQATAVAVEILARQVAHDIRSPLTALKMSIQRFHNQDGGEILKLAAERISEIADDLLKRRAITSTNADVAHTSFAGDPVASVRYAIASYLPEVRANSSVDVHYKSKSSANESQEVDLQSMEEREYARQFTRVLANVVQNAIEAPRIETRAQVVIETEVNRDRIQVSVSDNGLGIDETAMAKIGNRGFTVGKFGGNGLGLSHARDWTEACGGRLRVRTSKSSGTRVEITLPR